MSKNRGEIKTAMRLRLGLPSDDTTALPDAVMNDIIDERCRSLAMEANWQFIIKTSTALTATVLGQYEYDLPTDWGKMYSVYITDADGNHEPLTPMAPQDFDDEYPDPTDVSDYDEPLSYSIRGNHMYLGPTPGAAYTMVVKYFCYPVALSADSSTGSTNEITENLPETLLHWCVADGALYLYEPERASYYTAMKDASLRKRLIQEAQSFSSGARPISEEP